MTVALNKILIGGQALKQLGSSRHTEDFDYLIHDETLPLFSVDEDGSDLINAAKSNFFGLIYHNEAVNTVASPASLLELKAFAFVQHLQNFNFQKADDCEYDIRFLVRKFDLEAPKVVKDYLSLGEYAEVEKIVNAVKR